MPAQGGVAGATGAWAGGGREDREKVAKRFGMAVLYLGR